MVLPQLTPEQLVGTTLLPHEMRFTGRGRRGETTTFAVRSYTHFRIESVTATDDGPSPGQTTRIGGVFVGCATCYLAAEGLPSRDLGAHLALGALRTAPAVPFLDITINVTFLDACEWSIVLAGTAFKKLGDTEADLRRRAIQAVIGTWRIEKMSDEDIARRVRALGWSNDITLPTGESATP